MLRPAWDGADYHGIVRGRMDRQGDRHRHAAGRRRHFPGPGHRHSYPRFHRLPDAAGEHTFSTEFLDAGVNAYAFTFG